MLFKIYRNLKYFHIEIEEEKGKLLMRKRYTLSECYLILTMLEKHCKEEDFQIDNDLEISGLCAKRILVHLGNIVDNYVTDGVIPLLSHEELMESFERLEENGTT